MKKTFIILLFISLFPLLIKAQWNGNPSASGNAVSTALTSEDKKISITDGSNGSIVVFESRDINTNAYKIYVQRITSGGSVAWGTVNNPNAISASGDIGLSHAIPDGAGEHLLRGILLLFPAHQVRKFLYSILIMRETPYGQQMELM